MVPLSSCLAQSRAPAWFVQVPTPVWLTRPTVLTASCAAQLPAQSPCYLSRQSAAMTTSLTPAPATSAGPPASSAAPLESATMATATVRLQKTQVFFLFCNKISNNTAFMQSRFVFVQIPLGNLTIWKAVKKTQSRWTTSDTALFQVSHH